MAKIGDRVRFLNTTGGGVITRIDGKTAYVEDEDGFESPILLKDVVVVLPAGYEAAVKGSHIMFDQKAFDAGKMTSEKVQVATEKIKDPGENLIGSNNLKPETVEETKHGDIPSLTLAFEPQNIKRLSDTKFTGVLVNDSNYFVDFVFLKRSAEDRGWETIFRGTVNPNELIDVVVLSHEDLPEFGRVALQGILYKNDKAFSLLPPLNVTRKIDLTKFHKLHCFRKSKYFDVPVLEFPLVTKGDKVDQISSDELNSEISEKNINTERNQKLVKGGNPHRKGESPFKKLPLIEVDLHIGELTDTLAGMEPKDMLEMQLEEVRKTMKSHEKRRGQKIVFIHGKGEGVLRKAVLDFLKKNYPKAELQDASFREYGFGATLVTIH